MLMSKTVGFNPTNCDSDKCSQRSSHTNATEENSETSEDIRKQA